MSFWLKCSPSIADWTLKVKVSWWCPQRKKNALRKTENLNKIRPKLAQIPIPVMRSLRPRPRRHFRELIFHNFIRIDISWESAKKILKIRPTVAELSVKNHFPIPTHFLLFQHYEFQSTPNCSTNPPIHNLWQRDHSSTHFQWNLVKLLRTG